jgi:hypothetical protein
MKAEKIFTEQINILDLVLASPGIKEHSWYNRGLDGDKSLKQINLVFRYVYKYWIRL